MASVVITTRNRKNSLQKCLSRIHEQTYRPLQVIVVDNGSEDGTAEFLRGFSAPDSGIETTMLRLPFNAGVPGGRNRGAARVHGSHIVWLDDDCRFDGDDAVEKLMERFIADDSISVLAYPVKESGSRGIRYLLPGPRSRVNRPFHASYFLGAACAMRTDFFMAHGPFDDSFQYQLEELEFSLRMARSGIGVHYVPSPVVVHEPVSMGVERTRRFYFFHTRNRIWLAVRFFPFPVLLVHACAWLERLFWGAVLNGAFRAFAAGLFEGIRGIRANLSKRKELRLSWEVIRWLFSNNGRVWF